MAPSKPQCILYTGICNKTPQAPGPSRANEMRIHFSDPLPTAYSVAKRYKCDISKLLNLNFLLLSMRYEELKNTTLSNQRVNYKCSLKQQRILSDHNFAQTIKIKTILKS